MNNNIEFSNHEIQYRRPEVCVTGLDNQGAICQASPVDGEMLEGDDNW